MSSSPPGQQQDRCPAAAMGDERVSSTEEDSNSKVSAKEADDDADADDLEIKRVKLGTD